MYSAVVDDFLDDNRLKNNPDKLITMVVCNPKQRPELPLVVVGGTAILIPSRSARNLGVLFDESLSFE